MLYTYKSIYNKYRIDDVKYIYLFERSKIDIIYSLHEMLSNYNKRRTILGLLEANAIPYPIRIDELSQRKEKTRYTWKELCEAEVPVYHAHAGFIRRRPQISPKQTKALIMGNNKYK